ncbi:MAG: UDP-N-acetylglucosamine 2-epimerase (non-hydrolyzing) [Anaerolineae bacterium]|nr:UDP-N-acetylglucosamine 2-epimerase (non-hydrolyzing) [Anaerolineae bacterium]
MKIVSIVGARPQFIKAAAISRVLRKRHTEFLVHTGQHYDSCMSSVFFEELGIPEPDINLGVGSGSHGKQTGAMLAGIEALLIDQRPDWTLVYGDTNSTLAGALAAAKLHIPVAHVEAGLRSFNRAMPEEINRVAADVLSNLLLCPSQIAIDNLAAEGISKHVYLVGDVMSDSLTYAATRSRKQSTILEQIGLRSGEYLLATVHRAENTDDEFRLRSVLHAFEDLGEALVFPVHPRTRKVIDRINYTPPDHIHLIGPVGYLNMVMLAQSARMILTDSGGLQKEAYWLKVPCITLREETEWVETVQVGWNIIAGTEKSRIIDAVQTFTPPAEHPPLYGDGQAAARCVVALENR